MGTMRDMLKAFSAQPNAVNDGETWISCSDIRPGDVIPDIGTIEAVSEPASDGTFHVQAGGRPVTLTWGGVVRRRG
jgi:hypothetical protein